MKKAVILHGTLGSPVGNWFRWLEKELTEKGVEVWLPELPHAERPSLREWVDFVAANCPFELDNETYLIGHSSGAILALAVAQENQMKLKNLVCVSVFSNEWGESVATRWDPNERLFDLRLDWNKIRKNVEQPITLIHSDDDPYIPLEQAEWIAGNLNADLVVLPGQGHFNLEKSSKYSSFPVLLEILQARGVL